MLKDIIFGLLRPFLELYICLRFRDYWNLKRHLQRRPSKLLRLCYDHHFMRLGSFVGVDSQLDGIPYFPHGCRGVFISNDAVIGKNAVIFQQVTIGSCTLSDTQRPGSPVIGSDAYLGAGCKIIGSVTIGDRCRVGANAVVYQDMPDDSVAVCGPTRLIQKQGLDNTFHTVIHGIPYVSRDGRLMPERKHDAAHTSALEQKTAGVYHDDSPRQA